MNKTTFTCRVLAICFVATTTFAEPAVQQAQKNIQLKEVWALDMPGTRDIRKLKSSKEDLVELIQQSLGRKTRDALAVEGFVVQGKDTEALRMAYDVLVSGKATTKRVKAKQPIWVVFFSRNSSQFVHLHKVERQDDQVTVRYQFVPHDSKELTRHFALIPLGEMPAGKYRVSVVNIPMARQFADVGYGPIPATSVSRIVCHSFEFTIAQDIDH